MERQNPLLRRRPGRPRPRAMWTIRAKILTLLLLPVVPLLAMWMFTTGATLGPALNLFAAVTNLRSAGQPATAVIDRLQVERQLSMSWVGGRHDTATRTALTAARTRTDAAAATFRRDTATSTFRHAESDTTRGYLGVLDSALGRLATQRSAIDHAGTASHSGGGSAVVAATADDVMTYYNGVIDNAVGLYGSVLGADDHDLARQANTVNGLTQAHEMFAREDAIVMGAIAAHKLPPADYTDFVATVGTERYLYQQATRFLPLDEQRTYQAVLASPAFTRLRGDEDLLSLRSVTDTGLPAAFDGARWHTDFDAVDAQLTSIQNRQAAANLAATRPAAVRIVVRLAVAGGVGLIVLIALIVISVRLARNIIARIHGLRADALDLARHRLPSVVERLRRGESVDVALESPALAYGTDEVGQLGEAFSRVQRTAIAAAVQEAELRRGLNHMFLNIARRSQTLLHRQLSLLDDMERRVTDPDDLSELFRIDHLATRMRRHAEDLVILAGATPGRAWRYPVALTDVLRAAAAEVEQYTRISVRPLPDVAVAGRAVGDTVHLVAELLENATAFSAPDTPVSVAAQLVPHGFAVEIEDRGLGMTPDALAEANARLSAPPDFHPEQSTRLGLFVVTRLAAKHGIAVTLRRSPFGGITAVVLLPAELVVAEADALALTSSSARAGTRMLTAAPAGSPPPPPENRSELGDPAELTGPADPADLTELIGPTGPSEAPVVDAAATEPDAATGEASNLDTNDVETADVETADKRETGTAIADPADANAATVDATTVDAGDRRSDVPHLGPTLPRQRALTLVTPAPPPSTVRGVTAEGLPQRVRPTGRGDRAVRIAPAPATDDVVTDAPVTTAPVRTDGDATPREAPRSPERMRTMLTSFQDGTALGRRRQAADSAVPEAGATGGPAAPADTEDGSIDDGGTDTGEAGGRDR